MSKGLFDDMPLAGETNIEEDFFSKIEEIEVDYSVLGDRIVRAVEFWARSFVEKIKYYGELKKFKDTYWEKARESSSHYFEDTEIPDFMGSLRHSMKDNVLTLVRQKFGISTPDEMESTLAEKEFDFTSAGAMLDIIMKYTNNGDADDIKRQQLFNRFSKYVSYRRPDMEQHTIKKNKITLIRFVNSYKSTIWNEYEIHYSSRWDTVPAWIDVIDYFAKEQNIPHALCGSQLFDLLKRHDREQYGIYEKQENKDNEMIISTKLFKNGKMELVFKNEALAQSFWDDWIKPTQIAR